MDTWRYCPVCGRDDLRVHEARDPRIVCDSCGFTKYDNPLPTTIGVVEDGDRVLLLRRAQEPRRGCWDAVGGFLSGSETAEDCLRREALEEIGTPLSDLRPLGTYSSVYGSTGLRTIAVAFVCTLADAEPVITLSDENSEHAWFRYDALPPVAFSDVADALHARRARRGSSISRGLAPTPNGRRA